MRVAQLLAQYAEPEPEPLLALHQTLAVVAGRQWLSLGELRSLRPGDVLMLEQGPGLLLDLDGRLQARCQYQGEVLRLQEALRAPLWNRRTP